VTERMLTCFPGWEDLLSPPTPTECAPSSSARSTEGAETSSPALGPESPSMTTCAPSAWPTPNKMDAVEVVINRTWEDQQARAKEKLKMGIHLQLPIAAVLPRSGFSPQESPASPPPAPESSEEAQMTAGSGRRLCACFDCSTPLGRFSKILLESEMWASPEFSLKWKVRVTKCGCTVFQLAPSARRTEGSGTGSWPTPAKRDEKGQTQNPERMDYVPNIVKGNGMIASGCLARTESFVVRLTTLSAWLMGYTAQYLAHWETASSRKSRKS
jgi:hypothetical protein